MKKANPAKVHQLTSRKIINGRLFRVYFRSLYEDPTEKRITCCVVIAEDVTDALRKISEAFPGEHVSSIHEDTGIGYGPSRPQVVLI